VNTGDALELPQVLAMMRILLDAGADIDGTDPNMETALHKACTRVTGYSQELCEFLIANGADVNATNKDWYTPLFFVAADNKGPDLMKFLISKGADVNA